MSIIGEECARSIWYSFRWASITYHDAALLRLFDRGKREEERFVGWLRMAGVTVHHTNPATGTQYRFTGYKGHVGGEIDGVGEGIIPSPYLLEFKTHNANSFRGLVLNHVEIAKPSHYVQVNMYMGAFNLHRTLYLGINKDTDALYEEVIPFNEGVFQKYMTRAIMIVDATEPPPKLSTDPSWYKCKWCDHYSVCHRGVLPQVNCRTCIHSTPVDGGNWICEHEGSNHIIPEEVIWQGCSSYHRHPME